MHLQASPQARERAQYDVVIIGGVIEDDLAGSLDSAALQKRITVHNKRFVRSYERWVSALYLGITSSQPS